MGIWVQPKAAGAIGCVVKRLLNGNMVQARLEEVVCGERARAAAIDAVREQLITAQGGAVTIS